MIFFSAGEIIHEAPNILVFARFEFTSMLDLPIASLLCSALFPEENFRMLKRRRKTSKWGVPHLRDLTTESRPQVV